MVAAATLSPVRAQPVLTLDQAGEVALERDAVLKSTQERAQALRERAVADGALPDPQLKLGAMNLPVDTFDTTQEPMTQMQVGVQQMFPRGDTLALQERKAELQAQGEDARGRDQSEKVLRATRLAWLELYYWTQSERVVARNEVMFQQLAKITELYYAQGRRNQQDVTRAQLELGLLQDRLIRIQGMGDTARADLLKWIGPDWATVSLPASLPTLPPLQDREGVAARLGEHPLMAMEQSQVAVSQTGVEMAREAYKPGWMLDLSYGFRDGEDPGRGDRADFFSAMVVVDLPVFTSRRQDRRLAASQHELAATQQMREERYRELERMLDAGWADWQRLAGRVTQYETVLLPKARENTQAARNAYQSEAGDFTSLMRAQIYELETELETLRLRVEQLKAQAKLLYLVGDAS